MREGGREGGREREGKMKFSNAIVLNILQSLHIGSTDSMIKAILLGSIYY